MAKTTHVIDTKDLETRYAEAQRNLTALNAVATVASRSLELETVLNGALKETLEIMKVNTGGILLLNQDDRTLYYRAHHGLSRQYIKKVRCRIGEGISGRVAETGKAILVEDISRDARAAYRDLIAAEGLRAFASVPICLKDKILGVLNVAEHGTRKFSDDDTRLLNSVAAHIAIAIENAKLHQEVRSKEKMRGELLQDIFTIQEEERKRIARELHDEASQALASLTASLEAAVGMLPPSQDKTKVVLRKAQSLSVNILNELHRLIYELRPTLLDDLGLVAAIRWLMDNKLVGIKVDFKIIGKVKRLSAGVETTIFRVLQEAVNNIVRHAHAKRVDINLSFKKECITVSIKDDGKGFDVEEAMRSKDRPRGLGLLGMKERVELVNGVLDIRSSPGNGTEIDIEVALKKEVPSDQKKNTRS